MSLPGSVGPDEIRMRSERVLARPRRPVERTFDVFRFEELGLQWDLGVAIYEPIEESHRARFADGRRIGLFLLHGGSGDFKDVEELSLLYAERFGYRVVAGTFPGRFAFEDPDAGWPGDTIRADGSVRTPEWLRGEVIGRDEYTVVEDDSLRDRYGVRTLARALPGSRFYDRMASWPAAFETGMIEACRRHLPASDFAAFGEGHSTGGPFIFMLSQRVPNMVGVLAAEHSPFGEICASRDMWAGPVGKITGFDRLEAGGARRSDRFDELYIRTWRDLARYAGPEALGRDGPQALMRLPRLIEDVFAAWERERSHAQFKAEYIVTHGVLESLEAAAQAVSQRLGLEPGDAEALRRRYLGFTDALRGPEVPPVPPIVFAIAKNSRDHSPEVYEEVILPAFAALDPAPRTHLVAFGLGGHSFWREGDGLPLGIAPAVVEVFDQAIEAGYFVTNA